jgi:hypothetical protein
LGVLCAGFRLLFKTTKRRCAVFINLIKKLKGNTRFSNLMCMFV